MRRTDYPHHSPGEVEGYLAQAARIVAALELDGDLKVPAFVEAVRLLAAKQIVMEQAQMVPEMLAIPGNKRR